MFSQVSMVRVPPLTFSPDTLNLFLNGNSIASYKAREQDSASINKTLRSKRDVAGTNIPIDINVLSFASMVYLSDSSKLYLLRLVVPNSREIGLRFDKFYLPPGSRFYVYNSSKIGYEGGYTSLNNKSDSTFKTFFMSGDTIYVEYYEPKGTLYKPKIHMKKIAYLFSFESSKMKSR